MAQTGFTPIQLYYSTTATNVPLAGNLAAGELALNTIDEKLYFKNSAGIVTLIASSAGAVATVSSVGLSAPSFLTVSNSPITTTGTIALTLSGVALPTTSGGTGVNSYASGDMLYYSAGAALTKLTIGTNTQILSSNGTVPVWVDASSVSVNTATNLAGGATGSVPFQSGAGATTFLALGTSGQVMTAGPSGPQYVDQSTLSVGFATNATNAVNATNAAASTNLAGGTANQIPFQTGAGATSFITAPSTPNYVLTWTGSAFNWASVPSVTSAGNLVGGAAGDLVFQSATNVSAFLPDIAVGNALLSGGVGVAPSYGKIGLTTHVSGTLPIANGGTNSTAAPTSGAIAYGTGTAFAFTTVGAAGQALVSGGAGAPVWQDFPQVPSFLLINAGVS